MALYARVSTEEQTKGNYPSCTSQLEELATECEVQNWAAEYFISDEGYTAGTLRRPGLQQIRELVAAELIDGIVCTWYDRLTRSREFYILDHEFHNHNVQFITLHDSTDTSTASGRFMESVLVAAKTYDREQTSEKVRTKMRMRLEKGLHNGGMVPFAFLEDKKTQLLIPDAERIPILEQMFGVYIDTQSDFAVRDWLKAHGICTVRGAAQWQVGTISSLLTNRRYIGEIEVNRHNKGLAGLKNEDAYRIVQAPHPPLVPTRTV